MGAAPVQGERGRSAVVEAGRVQWALRPVDAGDPTPKYVQARDILVEAIRSGPLPPGSKLPSTKMISEMVNISLITAHRALSELVEDGLLRREVGRGTFVSERAASGAGEPSPLSIALILSRSVNLDDYYHSTILNGLRRAAEPDGAQVEFLFQERYDLRSIRRRRVAGICVHPPFEDQAEIEKLAQRYPLVLLGGSFPGSRLARVDCDNFDGARQATRHLLGLGHRRFVILSGPLSLSNSRDRADGARAELTDAGVALADAGFIVAHDSVVLDTAATVRLQEQLSGRQRCTAIVCGGYYLALGAMQIVRQMGLDIPRDVSIVGFDDPVSAPLLNPPLTTVRQPLEAMARRAYEVVKRAVRDGAAGMSFTRLPTELAVRGSTGPAPVETGGAASRPVESA
jgi:GntR family transcriptional regulator of arabinose operon